MNIDRREFLRLASLSGVSLTLDPGFFDAAVAQAKSDNKFVIYIHYGSADGWASNLLQASSSVSVGSSRREAVWPKGVFVEGENTGSLNPNVNAAHPYGGLVFNNYSKCMLEIADHMCFGVGNPRSAGHVKASYMQSTGGGDLDHYPGWVSGAANLLYPNEKSVAVSGSRGAQSSVNTPNIVRVSGNDLEQYISGMSDGRMLPKSDLAKDFWSINSSLFDEKLQRSSIEDSNRVGYQAALSSLVRGVPEFAEGGLYHADILSLQNKLSAEAVESMIRGSVPASDDQDGIVNKQQGDDGGRLDTFRDKLILAGLLAKSGNARGMGISYLNEDYHSGYQDNNEGSTVGTARKAGYMWASIRNFWDWIKDQGMQDDVLVIVSHEFSRSPYNTRMANSQISVPFNGVNVPITVPGTDHWLAMGMVFINGKVPPASRIGAIGDTYVAAGTSGLNGAPASDLKPYTSTDLVVSMLMRVFDDRLPSLRDLQRMWPSMKDPIAYLLG